MKLDTALQDLFGFPGFREGQEEIVRRAVEGRDTLALMPTGAGKSLCYQLAAMLRPTPTLVISPLIALMKDQIDNLPAKVREHASLINSSLPADEAARRLRSLGAGEYRLIYAAPERLRQRQFVSALRSAGVGLVVIDEVHCVSMWGHDFRPDYLFIRPALESLGNPAVLGMTATATPATERDIAASLGRELEVIRTSVVRANLRYEVERTENEEDRRRALLRRARELPGSGIVYARAREKCEQLATLLQRNGVRALHYHAGLDSDERSRVQESFLTGKARVIVATTAFGMGIDKPDVRWVLLYNFPNSLESYVQMVGRAGRDGEPAVCVLLAGDADASSLRRFARADAPSVEDLRAVYKHLSLLADEGRVLVAPEELASDAGLSEGVDVRVLVGMLERSGLVRRELDSGRAMSIEILPPAPDSRQRMASLLATYEEQALARAERMVSFATSRRCRHLQVAEHFGEGVSVPCGMCDVCSRGEDREQADEIQRPLPEDVAGAILEAVDSLQWPLGVKGLVSMLKGSVAAPPSAQRAPTYGALAAAKEGTIRGWVGKLLESGHLEQFESQDGYRLLRVGRRTDPPELLPLPGGRRERSRSTPEPLAADEADLFERLRAWRWACAQERGVPAFTILPDRALRAIASARPSSAAELARLHGIGPAKLEQFGAELLRLVAEDA